MAKRKFDDKAMETVLQIIGSDRKISLSELERRTRWSRSTLRTGLKKKGIVLERSVDEPVKREEQDKGTAPDQPSPPAAVEKKQGEAKVETPPAATVTIPELGRLTVRVEVGASPPPPTPPAQAKPGKKKKEEADDEEVEDEGEGEKKPKAKKRERSPAEVADEEAAKALFDEIQAIMKMESVAQARGYLHVGRMVVNDNFDAAKAMGFEDNLPAFVEQCIRWYVTKRGSIGDLEEKIRRLEREATVLAADKTVAQRDLLTGLLVAEMQGVDVGKIQQLIEKVG